MKTKLLLTILLISCLAVSTLGQIPYEYFPNRSEDMDGEIPAAKIPNCIHQRGYECFACGPDTTGETPVPLIPNSNHRCVPALQSGCNRFLDPQGKHCDLAYGCACKFAIDSTKRTCVSTAKVANCFIFDRDNETCLQCVGLGRSYTYLPPQGITTATTSQPIPSGGGINDYGLSVDAKNCIDNIANGNPHCLKYSSPTSCNQCDSGYALVQTGTPGASLRKCFKFHHTLPSDCYAVSQDGLKCVTCNTGFKLDQQGACVTSAPNIPGGALYEDTNCLRWFKGPDGQDDTTRCAQCIKYSYLLQFNRCSVTVDSTVTKTINYRTGNVNQLNQLDYFCRLGYKATFDDQHGADSGGDIYTDQEFQYCMVQKAANDFYVATYTATPPATKYARADLNCDDFDVVKGFCNACSTNYYQNSLTGECLARSGGDCPLSACLIAEGLAYCTQCIPGFDLVDGNCYIRTFTNDSNTRAYCTKIGSNNQCEECDPQYFLDKTSGPDTLCVVLDTHASLATDCKTWLNGRCTACNEYGKAPQLVGGTTLCRFDGITWGENTSFGGVPGCKTHSTQDGICDEPYPYAFIVNDQFGVQSQTYIISNSCASYSLKGDCTLCNHIRQGLQLDPSTGLSTCQYFKSGNNICETSLDGGCTCATCKNTWLLTNNNCYLNAVVPATDPVTYVQPESVIRGCVKMASATTCEICRTPDFILTTDKLCYDLNFQRLVPTVGWTDLFYRYTGTITGTTTTVYTPVYYEPCTAASDVWTCTAGFNEDQDNMFLVTVDGTAQFTKSAIIYHHNQYDNYVMTKKLLVNDAATGSRDVTAKVLQYVLGCNQYTSWLAGTCDTCAATRTKQADNTRCFATDGSENTGTQKNCQAVDTTTGLCTSCANDTVYLFDSTTKDCFVREDVAPLCVGTNYDPVTYKCTNAKCIGGYLYTSLTANSFPECVQVRDSNNYSAGFACETSKCWTKTATFKPYVLNVNSDTLVVAECSQGSTLVNNRCILQKDDWATSVAEVDATTGKVQTCQPGYFNIGDSICYRGVQNCNIHVDVGQCGQCNRDANGQWFILANGGQLCISQQNFLPNCEIYNNSGVGCLRCQSGKVGLEATGCVLPPNCATVNPITLWCATCQTGFKQEATGQCIPYVSSTYAAAANCDRAYNSTHCAQCNGGRILAIDDLDNNNLYGVGECVTTTAPNGCVVQTGCDLVLRTVDKENCHNTVYECIRCQRGFALFDGKCYQVDDTLEYVPMGCINIEFNEDQKAYVCTECEFGYALTANLKYCVSNHGQCSYLDSNDCGFYEKAVGQEELQIECADERSSNSILLSAVLMIILNVIFFNI